MQNLQARAFAPHAWAERYGEFTNWLNATGFTTVGLPDWSADTAVHVVSMPGQFFLEKISDDELEAYQCLEQREGQWISTISDEQLHQRCCVRVVAADYVKLKAWQAQQGGVRA